MLPGHEALLKAIEDCRREANAARRMHRPRSGMVRCLDAMVDEMDAVAELVIVKANYFHDEGTTGNRYCSVRAERFVLPAEVRNRWAMPRNFKFADLAHV